MEHSLPTNLQQYLQPIINRILALELKNQHLEQQVNSLLTHLSLKSEKVSLSNNQTVNHAITTQPSVTKPTKVEYQVVKKPILTLQEQKIQSESKEGKKLAPTSKNVKLQPKKQERQRITSVKAGNVENKLSSKDLKKPNGSTTPTANKKISINEKKNQEEKTEVIVQILDLVVEQTPQKQPKLDQTPQKDLAKIEEVKQKESLKNQDGKGKSKPSINNKQTFITGKQKAQHRVSQNQNKLGSNKKIEGQDQQKKQTKYNNNKIGAKHQNNTKSTKPLKQNNKVIGKIGNKKQVEGEEQLKKQNLA